jgi:hypothetical protein
MRFFFGSLVCRAISRRTKDLGLNAREYAGDAEKNFLATDENQMNTDRNTNCGVALVLSACICLSSVAKNLFCLSVRMGGK